MVSCVGIVNCTGVGQLMIGSALMRKGGEVGVILIDMPMPKCCGECPFASANFNNGIMSLSCITPTGRSMYAPDLIYRKDRPAWCPLKEQEEMPFRCKTCAKHTENGICRRWMQEVKDDDYCSFGEKM